MRRFPARGHTLVQLVLQKKTWTSEMWHLRAAALLTDYSSAELKSRLNALWLTHRYTLCFYRHQFDTFELNKSGNNFQRWAVIRASLLFITSPVQGAIRTQWGLVCSCRNANETREEQPCRETAGRRVCIILIYHSAIWGETNKC